VLENRSDEENGEKYEGELGKGIQRNVLGYDKNHPGTHAQPRHGQSGGITHGTAKRAPYRIAFLPQHVTPNHSEIISMEEMLLSLLVSRVHKSRDHEIEM
jgi:hypothetical protein